ncbi:MAG TPA: cell division protein FtsQ [Xanthomonadaceae bacterium]|jgi:cell division protein FtsQ|nr:cell division protein FtsQ [Xanthomonadaceae bacterium]
MTRVWRLLGWTFALLLLAMPVVAVVNGWIGADRWPIRTLALQAPLKLVDEATLRATIAPMARGGFFAVDPNAIREAVAALPWVDKVDVRKRWPDRLEVRLTELRPYAHWGDDRLLSEDGRLFALPPGMAKSLPRFEAADGRVAEVIAFHRDARPVLVRVGSDIHELRLSARGGWSLTTVDGIHVELGRHDALPRLSRFARLLPTLGRDPAGRVLQRADLRYTNGFALTWGEAAAAPAAPSAAPLASSNA